MWVGVGADGVGARDFIADFPGGRADIGLREHRVAVFDPAEIAAGLEHDRRIRATLDPASMRAEIADMEAELDALGDTTHRLESRHLPYRHAHLARVLDTVRKNAAYDERCRRERLEREERQREWARQWRASRGL